MATSPATPPVRDQAAADYGTTTRAILAIVKDIKDLARTIHEAFYIASTGRKGPVLVDLPVDDYFPPYPTNQGIYVFRKMANVPARILPLNEVRENLRQAVRREKVNAFIGTYLEALKRDYPIRVIGTIQ